MSGYDLDFYWYWFVNIPEIGIRTQVQLLERYGHPSILYEVEEKELQGLLTDKQLAGFQVSKNLENYHRAMHRFKEEGICFLHWESQDYPDAFRNLYDPPYGFYLKGQLPPIHRPIVAIVGSRRSTPYGRRMAENFATSFASQGISVISGMAAGIDSIAHRSTLDAGGYTLGILGGGIDTMYPKTNWDLYLDMYQKGGILSEFNLGVPNQAGLFPMRNRLISGLADAVLVIEAGTKSGSLITADQAIDQGKEVFALPGRVTDPMSIGCNHLIAQGANVAERPEDILEYLKMKYQTENRVSSDLLATSHSVVTSYSADTTNSVNSTHFAATSLSEEESNILSYLDISQPVSFEFLLEKTGESIPHLQKILMNLEEQSLIYQPVLNMYLKKF